MTDVQLKDIVLYLERNGYNCVLNEDDETILIDVPVCGRDIHFKCDFPISFPYTFPKIYLQEVSFKEIFPLPHVNKKGYICTYDSNVSFPNFNMPSDLVLESIKKAVQIIKDGIEGINQTDFIEEFKAYWKLESTLYAFTLFEAKEQPLSLYSYVYKNLYYIGEDKTQLKDYICATTKGIDEKNIKFERCIYLPLDCRWIPPYPQKNSEFYSIVRENKECFHLYKKYLSNRTKQSVIIFSQVVNGNRCLAGWTHLSVKTPQGFREGKVLPNLVYIGTEKNNKVLKIDVMPVDHKRLFYRGGDGKMLSNKKVSVTGCGSVGSYLIQGLSELGIMDYVLIDKEKLLSENIARHICGASEIGQPKPFAIKNELIKHFPSIKCDAKSEDVFKVINNENSIFNNCDYNFIVVGDIPIETKFIELFNQKSIHKTTVLIWVEPFMLGGHAIVLQQEQDILSILYDSEYNFLNKVLIDGQRYTKKESGCQSTFIPYSGFEVRQFIYSFVDFFNTNIINDTREGNYLFSWCGKLSWARKENMPISDKWLAKDDRTQIVRRLD